MIERKRWQFKVRFSFRWDTFVFCIFFTLIPSWENEKGYICCSGHLRHHWIPNGTHKPFYFICTRAVCDKKFWGSEEVAWMLFALSCPQEFAELLGATWWKCSTKTQSQLIKWGSSEEQRSLSKKNKTPLHEWILERSSLFICLIITLRKLVDLEKSLNFFFLVCFFCVCICLHLQPWSFLADYSTRFFCDHERKRKENGVHWNCCLCKVAEILFKFTFNNSTQRQKRNALLFCTHYAYLGSKL